ncbi:MAG TPA: site-specific integrase [Lactobacillaceae bacterium]
MVVKNNIETRTLTNQTQTFRAIVTFHDEHGKQHNLYSATYRDPKDAQSALKELKTQAKDMAADKLSAITPASDFVDAYLYWYKKYKQAHHEALTIDQWIDTSTWLRKEFGQIRLKAVSEARIKRVAIKYAETHSTQRDGTLAKRITHVKTFLEYAANKGIIAKNPLTPTWRMDWFGTGVKAKQTNFDLLHNKERLFTNDEMSAIRKTLLAIDYSHDITRRPSKMALLIMAYTGIRPEEVQALKASDIRRINGKIKFVIHDSWNNKHHFLNGRTKNLMKRETIALPTQATQLVEDYLKAQSEILQRWQQPQADPFIVLNVQNPKKVVEQQPITQGAINKQLKAIAEKLEITRPDVDIVAYSLRHTVATELSKKVNGQYEKAAHLMGHTLKQYLATYLHTQKDEVSELGDNLFD